MIWPCSRPGFKALVGEVSLGNAGMVLGLEVSRLARNSSDWHQLVEICARTDTLILDEDGIYDPNAVNDRLLLGIKSLISEVELHYLKARMQGGIRNAAKRGELKLPLPIGLAYDPLDRVVLDPDGQARESIRLLFGTFARTGSATATVKAFREQGLLFPRRPRSGPNKGRLVWVELTHSRTLQILHNPRYAGAFVFGRRKGNRRPDGTVSDRMLPLDEVEVLLRDRHEGYITWRQFEANRQRWRERNQSSISSISLPLTLPGPSIMPRLLEAVGLSSRRAVASFEQGSMMRAMMAASARSARRCLLRSRIWCRPSVLALASAAATWPCGSARFHPSASSMLSRAMPSLRMVRKDLTISGGNPVRFPTVL